ncbi:NTP transferase domain-containing protein [Desulfobacterota bacterium M19]
MNSIDTPPLHAIVLAAGKGTRMKSARAKVLHPVLFSPMICHVMDSLSDLDAGVVVVTGHQAAEVEAALALYPVSFVRQAEQLGTGHAVLSTADLLENEGGTALILCGDTPLIRSETLNLMVADHRAAARTLTVMTTILGRPDNYGRIICNQEDELVKIVEERDADSAERQIKEVNAGIYCVEVPALFAALRQVGSDNAQGEIYLTDIVEIICRHSKTGRFICPDPEEIMGVNSRVEQEEATRIMQRRVNQQWMLAGVSLVGQESIFIERSSAIGIDTTIQGPCYITGRSIVGRECEIGPFCIMDNYQAADGSRLKPFTEWYGNK